MRGVMCRCRMRTKQKGKMTFTGTSNASSSGLQRTGSEISDSKFPSLSHDLRSLAVCLCICHLQRIALITSCGENAKCKVYVLVVCMHSGNLICFRQCSNMLVTHTHWQFHAV